MYIECKLDDYNFEEEVYGPHDPDLQPTVIDQFSQKKDTGNQARIKNFSEDGDKFHLKKKKNGFIYINYLE